MISIMAKSQFLEFGGGVGVLNYSGDLGQQIGLNAVKPAVTIHHRLNFSNYLSLKWSLKAGKVSGTDGIGIDPFATNRATSFSITVVEIAPTFEYHFLDYKHDKSPIKWSPYAFAGVGFARLYGYDRTQFDFNKFQTVLPFGIGFKQLLGRKFALDIETGFRKTFFDELDGVSANSSDLKDYQYGNPNDNDWYFFTGVSLSFVLYEIPCPFPYIPNRYMLKANFR